MNIQHLCLLAAFAAFLATPGRARAENEGAPGGPGMHYDNRHHHNHYYPDQGLEVHVLPPGATPVSFDGQAYSFADGAWYQGRGERFIVVPAPLGAAVPALPVYATHVNVGGAPFVYLNDTYYWHRPDGSGYEVVAEPEAGAAPGAVPAAASPAPRPPAQEKLIAYPKLGQSSTQQARDREECHRWAVAQAGYDPTQPAAGGAPATAEQRSDYRRAREACMEARAYVVR